MAFCGSASWWVKVALLVIIIAFIFEIIGFATTSWMYYSVSGASLRVGLWKTTVCNSAGTCADDTTSTGYKNDSFRATQAMEVIAFVFFLVLPFVIAVYVFAEASRVWKFAVACMILCFLAAFFITIGMIIWLTYVYSPFIASWSMGFTIMAGIMALIAMLLFIPEIEDDAYFWWSRRYDNSREDAFYTRGTNRGYYTQSPTILYSRPTSQSIYLPPSRRAPLALPPPETTRTKLNPIYEPSLPRTARRSPSPPFPRTAKSPSIPRTAKISPTPPLTPSDINATNLRPATFNNVSDITLQRDRVFR